jgi:hypothetical protein
MHSINDSYTEVLRKKILTDFSNLEALDVYGKIILKHIFSKCRGRVSTGIARLRTGISLGQHIFRIYKMHIRFLL